MGLNIGAQLDRFKDSFLVAAAKSGSEEEVASLISAVGEQKFNESIRALAAEVINKRNASELREGGRVKEAAFATAQPLLPHSLRYKPSHWVHWAHWAQWAHIGPRP